MYDMPDWTFVIVPLFAGWLLDLCLGDPMWLPHPVVGFGKWIAFWERRLNRGGNRKLKGAVLAVVSIALVFGLVWLVFHYLNPSSLNDSAPQAFWGGVVGEVLMAIVVFYCLAGTTLFREVRDVFFALDRSLDEGRQQVARIVGRDTSQLTAQEVRTAALETLAENLSDGVVAPLFWFALLGAPGMLAYKMVNTLDSMIGYRTERYRDFGCWAARIDDVANYIPARLTALLMIISKALIPVSRESRNLDKLDSSTESSGNKPKKKVSLLRFVRKFGRCHASPNSGYPEAALAGILDCRFGGPHIYFGELIDKPYIGTNDRPLTTADLRTSLRICFLAEYLAVAAVFLFELLKTL
jgi:adenosylcobinamide-phosphate synthase